jgi:hypothetical protein
MGGPGVRMLVAYVSALVLAHAAYGLGETGVPHAIVGTYVRAAGAETLDTLIVAGGAMAVSGDDNNSVSVFSQVRCDTDTRCSFTTKDRCSGTLVRSRDGGLTIAIEDTCSWYEGSWIATSGR